MAKTLKKTSKKTAKPATKPEDTAFVIREDLEEQWQNKPSASEGVGSSKTASSAPAPAPSGAPSPAAAKPLAPLATVWPSSTAVPAARPIDVAALTDQEPARTPATPTQTIAEPTRNIASEQRPVATKAVNVTFALADIGAKRVFLCGDFNGWSTSATPMESRDDGYWETTVRLTPGKYEYKFLVDGEWVLDPAAQETVTNSYGSLNSLREVRVD